MTLVLQYACFAGIESIKFSCLSDAIGNKKCVPDVSVVLWLPTVLTLSTLCISNSDEILIWLQPFFTHVIIKKKKKFAKSQKKCPWEVCLESGRFPV